jgi:uncharacterized protein YycO
MTTTEAAEPGVGDFAVCSSGGNAGKTIAFGEWLCGDQFTQYQHAFIYVGDGRIIEAAPDGCAERFRADHAVELWSTGIIELTDAQRRTIVAYARQYIGVGYSWADYVAIAAHRLQIPFPHLKAYIASTGHQICSQLVDQCYLDAGVHLFCDGRWPGMVTPADLAGLLLLEERSCL